MSVQINNASTFEVQLISNKIRPLTAGKALKKIDTYVGKMLKNTYFYFGKYQHVTHVITYIIISDLYLNY